jgi:hypothetical protein
MISGVEIVVPVVNLFAVGVCLVLVGFLSGRVNKLRDEVEAIKNRPLAVTPLAWDGSQAGLHKHSGEPLKAAACQPAPDRDP